MSRRKTSKKDATPKKVSKKASKKDSKKEKKQTIAHVPATLEKKSVVIVGAGLVGSLLAIYLARRGMQVELYENRTDIRKAARYTGRSINLALSERGRKALREVGMEDAVKETGIPMYSRYIHTLGGGTAVQPYGIGDQHLMSIDRRLLNEQLMTAAEQHPNVKLFFNRKCENLSLRQGTVIKFVDNATGKVETKNPDLVCGTDGAYSVVRAQLTKTDRFDFRQYYIPHGYKELRMPAGADGNFVLPPNHLHIWPRGSFMMIALPNQDKTFTCTLFMPFTCPEGGFDAIKTKEDLVKFFDENFSDAVPLMPTLVEDYFANPTGTLISVECSRYHHGNQVAILGDAAHAMVPFYGQGMNSGLEDCRVFDEIIGSKDVTDLTDALSRYSARRVVDGHAICELALENYVEMRAHTASTLFLYRSKLEKLIHRAIPERFIPQYTMVSFTNIPYAEVKRRRTVQGRYLDAILLFVALLIIAALLYVFWPRHFGVGEARAALRNLACDRI